MRSFGEGRKYYEKYKETFDSEEWQDEVERLIGILMEQELLGMLRMVYRKESRWKDLADFLHQHPNLDDIERDADKLLKANPQTTLDAFEKALDTYAERNTGRPYYRENIYEAGIEKVERHYGAFKVYNKPKTVCDMFHYRNKIGEDLAFEGLKNYLNHSEANPNELQEYMKICRVKTVMKPYLKALVSG